jgi:hypothetical protein
MSGHDTLRGYLRSILWRTAALHAVSGMVSFLAALSWVLLAVVLWTAVVDTPGLDTATWIARTTIGLAALLFGYFADRAHAALEPACRRDRTPPGLAGDGARGLRVQPG